VGELAILGGEPTFVPTLRIGRPNIGNRADLFARLDQALDSGWLSNNGPFVQELEARIAESTGTRHAIAVCNATVGIEALAVALDLTGEVIIPGFTFAATSTALSWVGLTPVCADVDPVTHQIDPNQVARLINRRTSAILAVHLWGHAAPVAALQALADKHDLALIFDAAHAVDCTHRGAPIGGLGRAEVFSFHATKFVNSFEGGAITTQDDALAARIRSTIHFGMAHGAIPHRGTNGKMHEASAAMALCSLDAMPAFVKANHARMARYQVALASIPGLHLLPPPQSERCNDQYVVVEIDPDVTGLSRSQLLIALLAEGIIARPYFDPPCHHIGTTVDRPSLPFTERLSTRVFCLPTGTGVSNRQVDDISACLRRIVAEAPAVRKHLERGA
jgi:dTDP-4-amino-4,6-dideoxygalactose transaminase